MIIDLLNLPSGPVPFDFVLNPEKMDLREEGVSFRGDVAVQGTIERTEGRYRVRGTIESEQSIDCSRCLAPVERRSAIPFEVSYVPRGTELLESDHELGVADLDIAVLEGDALDLDEVVREQILLELPEQVFCRDDCKGLCEKCGANRNLIDCNCKEEEIDPRWSALKNLK